MNVTRTPTCMICPRCDYPSRHGYYFEVDPSLRQQHLHNEIVMICTNPDCLAWNWIIQKKDPSSSVTLAPRPYRRFYVYERVDETSYKLKGSLATTDAFEAATLWFTTRIYRVWKNRRSYGITTVRIADKKKLVAAKTIEPHFTYIYHGW